MPNWQPIVQDSFRRGSYPTAANGAGGTNVGAPDTLGTGAWDDAAGGTWSVVSNGAGGGYLQCLDGVNAFQTKFLLRPNLAAETKVSQRIVFTTVGSPSGGGNSPNYAWGGVLRYQSPNTYYGFWIYSGLLYIYRIVGGAGTLVGSCAVSGYDSRLPYVADMAVIGTTTAQFDGTIKQNGTTVATISAVQDASTPVALQGGGQMGLCPFSVAVTEQYAQFISYYDAPLSLTAGTITQTAQTASTVSLTSAVATGGTAPYIYDWQSSGNPNTGMTDTGLTALSIVPTPSTRFSFFRMKVTDSVGAVAYSPAFPVFLFSAVLPTLKLGFAGHSIVNYTNSGAFPTSPWQECVARLQGIAGGLHAVTGYDYSVSGTKSADWIAGSTNLNTALAAWIAAGVQYVNMEIGTNDARDLTPATTFSANLSSFCSAVNAAGIKVFLHFDPYRGTNSQVNYTVDQQNDMLLQYQAVIRALCNANTILLGDTTIFAYQSHAQEYQDLIHPNYPGVKTQGFVWAQAIASALGINIVPNTGVLSIVTVGSNYIGISVGGGVA